MVDLGNVWNTARHVLESGLVRLAVRDVLDSGRRLRETLHAQGQGFDRDFFGRSDVDDLAYGCRLVHKPDEGTGHVGDVREASRLGSVAKNSDRLPGEGLLDEGGNDHSVPSGLAWTDGIEQTHDDGRQPVLSPVGQGEKLVDGLGTGIAPASLGRRSQDERSVFAERHTSGETVDLGCGRDEHALGLSCCEREYDFRSSNVVLYCLDGALDDQPDADGRGEVKHHVAIVDELGEQRALTDVAERI